MGKGWGFKRVSSGSLGGSSWSGSRPIDNGEIANHPATNHPFWRQQFQNYQDRIKYPYHNARPSSSQPADNNPADPKFSPSRSLRELIKERMDEQRKCLKWMDEYFLTPLSDMASSAILDLDDEKQAKKLKKGLGDKQIDGETVAHIQRDAQAAAAYGGMQMMGMGMGEVPDANAPLEVRKVANKAERWRDPMGRFQELQTEIMALQKYALPPTQEDANGFMADFHQGLTEPMEARFKTMARIVGKGSGSDAKKSMEKPDGIREDLDDGSDSEDSLPFFSPRTPMTGASPRTVSAPATPSATSSVVSSVPATPVSRRSTALPADTPLPQPPIPASSAPPMHSMPGPPPGLPRPPAQGPPMQPPTGMPPPGPPMQPPPGMPPPGPSMQPPPGMPQQGPPMQPPPGMRQPGFPGQPQFRGGPPPGMPGPPRPGPPPPQGFNPQQFQQPPPQGPPPGFNPQQFQQPPQPPPTARAGAPPGIPPVGFPGGAAPAPPPPGGAGT